MTPENNRSDDYWMGVRDALRMVDSFIRWSSVNKERAKPIEDFIHDGLVAAAKRCESCLHKELGVDFDQEYPDDDILEDSIVDDDLSDDVDYESEDYEDDENEEDEFFTSRPDESFESTPPEIVLEPKGSTISEDVTIEVESGETEEAASPVTRLDDESVQIESMGIKEGSLESETTVTGEKREFSSDFKLVEPDPLEIGEDTKEGDETKDDEETDSSSWSESNETPETSPPAPPSDTIEREDEKKVWSPMDEPSPESIDDSDEDKEAENSESPPPPPPPETEESEEERRRRARRLFFGG